MKMSRCILSIAAIVAIFSLFPLPASAENEVRYLGEFCYALDEEKPMSGSRVTIDKVGVLSFGPGYFVLTGKTSPTLYGTAFVVAETNTIAISLYGSYSDSVVSLFHVRHMEVNSLTLKGTHTTMTVQTTPEPATISSYGGGVRLFHCD